MPARLLHTRPYSVRHADERRGVLTAREQLSMTAVQGRITAMLRENELEGLVNVTDVEAWLRCECPKPECATTTQLDAEIQMAIALVMHISPTVTQRLVASFQLQRS